jgi:hypothetical protein
MRLNIRFDEDIIRDYTKRGSPAFFIIYWQDYDIAYPSDDWFDFGATILDWWLGAAARLLGGSRSEELMFMDGPYALRIEQKAGLLRIRPRRTRINWEASVQELANELILGADIVKSELERLDASLSEIKSLELSIQRLKRVLLY